MSKPDTYATDQIDGIRRLGREDDLFAIQIKGWAGADGSTKWLTISPRELAAIRAVLALRTE